MLGKGGSIERVLGNRDEDARCWRGDEHVDQ